jgi:hypothetical protein
LSAVQKKKIQSKVVLNAISQVKEGPGNTISQQYQMFEECASEQET